MIALAGMQKGQSVVCTNDTFTETVRAIYQQLPVKGDTYTIRDVFLGREKIVKSGDSATVGLLLVELHNPADPFHADAQELGFSSERFAPMEELPPAELQAEAEQELELVGPGPQPWQVPGQNHKKWQPPDTDGCQDISR